MFDINQDIELQLALDENTPSATLIEIALKECEIVSLHLIDDYPDLELMMRECKNSTMILAAIAKNPNTPSSLLIDLFKYFPVEILNNSALGLILLENPNFLSEAYETNPEKYHIFGMDGTPLFFIEWGVNHFEKGTRESAVHSIKSHELLEKFSKHHNHLVRACVAENLRTPSHVLEILALDENDKVRQKAASNYNTPVDILLKLSQDVNHDIRCGVARNHKTPGDILDLLLLNQSDDIKQIVAGNPNVNIPTFEKLAQDKSKSVLSQIALNRKTPHYILKNLASHNDENILRMLAINSNTPCDVLEKLALHDVEYIRKLVAENQNASIQTLQKLATDKCKYVRREAMLNIRIKTILGKAACTLT
jgi:hypothetical protein